MEDIEKLQNYLLNVEKELKEKFVNSNEPLSENDLTYLADIVTDLEEKLSQLNIEEQNETSN
jgi:hypothetical protein